jgi:hypothetical protein
MPPAAPTTPSPVSVMPSVATKLSDFELGEYLEVYLDGSWRQCRHTFLTWNVAHHINWLDAAGREVVVDLRIPADTPARKLRRE